ncbi:hypothetical protein LQE92_09490 [Lacrimispora sp. NSJ-141]|uniref:Uncharacterized protein n=1 Tax=Lientehia hominis TaxID=2897778 RepID=A0AAP2RJ01_9FIRM|nr:hypothetical protein [Lientehia hominis]MCD2492862.1 hypothetical protein [Lientehia hominis]
MKKGMKYYGLIWLTAVAAFHAIVFLLPDSVTGAARSAGAFWSGYAGIMAAFTGQAVCSYLFFRETTPKGRFLNIPLVTLSYSGLLAVLIAGSLCMTVPFIPDWLGAVAAILILVFSAVAVIKSKAAAHIVNTGDKKIESRTSFMKLFVSQLSSLLDAAKSTPVYEPIQKLYEAARYSDPVSAVSLSDIESRMTSELNALSASINTEDFESARRISGELLLLIKKRAADCKRFK